MTGLFLIGAVLWSGQYSGSLPGENLPNGLTFLASQGVQSVKVPIDPSDLPNEFGITVTAPTDTSYLPNAMVNPAVQAGLGTPGIHNFVLSTYDAITTGLNGQSRNFANMTFLQSRSSDIVSTYYGMALALFRNYKNTGKTFIISTWETENSLYCGSAYSFDVTPSFRTSCLANYASTYGSPTPEAAFTAFNYWLQLREQGIQQARAQAVSEGDTGVSVLGGAEFVAIHLVRDLTDPNTGAPYPTFLYNTAPILFPAGQLDASTYSSYESLGNGTVLQDFPVIEQQTSGHPIAVSEFGFYEGQTVARGGVTYTADQLLTTTVQQFLSLGRQNRLLFATAWQAFTDTATPEFGLLTDAGAPTDLWTAVVAGETPVNAPAPTITQGAYDGYYGANAYITAYGANYAGSGDVITLNCGSGNLPNTNSYDSAGQLNIMFPSAPTARTCSIQVTTPNGLLSNVVTGILVAAAPPPPSINAGGAVYGGIYATNQYITLYGANFAGSGDTVSLNCGSSAVANTVTYDAKGQINLDFPSSQTARTCTVQVATVGQLSNVESVTVPAAPPPPAINAGGAVYDGVSARKAYATAYGAGFSGAGDTVDLNCGSGNLSNALTYDSAGQINIDFATSPSARRCTMQVITGYGLPSNVSTSFSVPAQ